MLIKLKGLIEINRFRKKKRFYQAPNVALKIYNNFGEEIAIPPLKEIKKKEKFYFSTISTLVSFGLYVSMITATVMVNKDTREGRHTDAIYNEYTFWHLNKAYRCVSQGWV